MKKITFTAEESLIQQAQLVARVRKTTLDDAFREWLQQYARKPDGVRRSMP